jgi:hypothetical protein
VPGLYVSAWGDGFVIDLDWDGRGFIEAEKDAEDIASDVGSWSGGWLIRVPRVEWWGCSVRAAR